jgi:hypothetical protein
MLTAVGYPPELISGHCTQGSWPIAATETEHR